jgi:hypothetical protein
MSTPKRLRPTSTRVGGPSPKKRRLMAVSLPPPVGLPSPMLQQYGHFKLKGSPKRKNFQPKKHSQASIDGKSLCDSLAHMRLAIKF